MAAAKALHLQPVALRIALWLRRATPGPAPLYVLAGLLALVQIGAASALGQTPFLAYFSPWGLGKMLPVWLVPPLIWLAVLAVKVLGRDAPRPITLMWRLLVRKRVLIGRAIILLIVLVPVSRAIGVWKDAIPTIVPFYADEWLMEADRQIFGTDPWRLTHALFGPVGTMLIDRLYSLWFLAMAMLIAWLAFTRDRRFQIRGILCYQLIWLLLGNVLATAMSSVGPCFYQDFHRTEAFAPLMASLAADNAVHPLLALPTMDYLRASVGTQNLGAGISAFPSIHVAIAFLIALACAARFGARLPTWLATVFMLAILIGSVHLGWHYAIDGLASLVGVAAIWLAVDKLVDRFDPVERRSFSVPSAAGR
jgi:hypothetical protein